MFEGPGKETLMTISVEIVVPCFNEQENLPALFESFLSFRKKMDGAYNVNLLIVDNGSTDETVSVCRTFVRQNSSSKLICLSRNFGKEASLTAGLMESTGDLVVPIDADLQDPIEVIADMLECWEAGGVEVVLARRNSRVGDSKARRFYSKVYIRTFSKLAEIEIPSGVGEFRLMSRKVVDAFKELPESQRFVRGLFSWMGFSTATIEFDRQSRDNGKSRFSFGNLINLGIDGIVSFSTKPLRISIGLGLTTAIFSFVLSIAVVFEKVFRKVPVQGYTSLAFLILFLGGIQLVSIGVLGEYIGKVLMESKRRPIYIISERY